jgi:hypothetical protein
LVQQSDLATRKWFQPPFLRLNLRGTCDEMGTNSRCCAAGKWMVSSTNKKSVPLYQPAKQVFSHSFFPGVGVQPDRKKGRSKVIVFYVADFPLTRIEVSTFAGYKKAGNAIAGCHVCKYSFHFFKPGFFFLIELPVESSPFFTGVLQESLFADIEIVIDGE